MMKKGSSLAHLKIYDIVTLGERGQVVIPANARKELGLKSGDKMVVIQPFVGEGVAMFKIEHLSRLMGDVMNQFGKINIKARESK